MTLNTGAIAAGHRGFHESHEHADNYLTHDRGITSWLFTLDHKRIGVMYMIAVCTAFFIGGMFAIMLRTMLWHPLDYAANPEAANRSYELYNHFFTLHGAVMVFMFMVPAIPAILGNFVLPMQLGAKDVAFPRLNLLSFWLYCTGSVFFLYLLFSGITHAAWGWHWPGGYGLDTGWTFYTPYSSSKAMGGVVPATLGIFILGFSSILTGVNFVATIHMLRPVGMTWFRMPLMLWALYSTALIQILATPVLGITVLLLGAERAFGIGIFDPRLGGDPVLFQHFFWFYSHPAVYIMILPAMGVISDVMVAFSRKSIFGYSFVAASSLAIALLSFLVWGHHMFVTGMSPLTNAVFSLITFCIAIPSAVKVFNWLGTMHGGSIRLKTPMLYALGFIFLFTIGGLTGLFLGSLSTDIHLTNTYFIVAHFHYVMMGSTLFGFMAGMYYWWPKMFGRMYSEKIAVTGFLLAFIGFNLTFFPQFIGGSQGLPRRYASYTDGPLVHVPFTNKHVPLFVTVHRTSTVGAYTLGSGLAIALLSWVLSLKFGPKAADNPWGANTLEWQTTSPPPHDNFKYTPLAGDPYDLEGWRYEPDTNGWVNPASQWASVSAAH